MKVKVLVTQSCLTLYNLMDYSWSGSTVHEIVQARILEWVAIPFSRGCSQPRDQTQVSLTAGRFYHLSHKETFERLTSQEWDFSDQFSRSILSESLRPHKPQHDRPLCSIPGVHRNPCPLSRWCHPTISSSVILFSFCLQSFSASGSFPMSQLFAAGGQSIGVSASTSVLAMNTQDWSPLGWTAWISLQSKGLSRVLSNTTVQKHQFFSAQLSL